MLLRKIWCKEHMQDKVLLWILNTYICKTKKLLMMHMTCSKSRYFAVRSNLFICGVYVDTDFECCRSFSVLHDTYDFYTGFQPLMLSELCLNIAIFGARRGHVILKNSISLLNYWQFRLPVNTGDKYSPEQALYIYARLGYGS